MTVTQRRGQVVLGGRWEYDTRVVFAAGSNAQTFAGRDLETDKEVVVKIFSHAAAGRGRERFLREVRLHEELKHGAILELLGRGPDGDVDYIVTPRLRPGALWSAMEDGGSRLSPAATLAIGTRIAGALAYMHGRGEVHGDISPGNVLLDGQGIAYLADFGFSKRVATAPAATTSDGFGTPGFNLPREAETPRTYEDDVYGLGAVLWFCLAGEAPAGSARERRRQIPRRSLRAPLVEALDWERGSIPSAEVFGENLAARWGKAAEDWRAVASAPPPRSRVPAVAVAALVGLALAWFIGQALQAKPADARTTVSGAGVSMNLDGDWHPEKAVGVSAFGMIEPIAVTRGVTTMVAGRAQSAGPGMLSADARASLPPRAREPKPVAIGERAALRYGPAKTSLGVMVEVFALPLARRALILRCTGPASALPEACAQAAESLELRDGSMLELAPTTGVVRRLRAATGKLSRERRDKRTLLASADGSSDLFAIATGLARANRSFAIAVAALPHNAQDVACLEAAKETASEVATAYAELAKAGIDTSWSAARAQVDAREQDLEAAIRKLGMLRAYGQ